MRGTECVHSPAPFIGRRRIAVGGRQSNRPNRSFCAWLDFPANKKKGQEPFPVPALSVVSELVEHAAMDRVDHPRCEMCWQDVVVTLVEGKVP